MSGDYSPDPGAQPQSPYTTVFLSQRDLGLRIPINYVTTPGVSLTAACFAHQQYEDSSYNQCVSNLLAIGYRRFEIDLYWDQSRRVWSFCPIEISPGSSSASVTSLVAIGPYMCTSTVNLSTFTSQLLKYVQKTQDTLGAHLIYVIINIHAAYPSDAPLEPAPSPSILPDSLSFVGSHFSSNLSEYIYTQSSLISNRANLNDSWYSLDTESRYRPLKEYFTIKTTQAGIASTEDGWPSESYIEFSEGKRLLLGWGRVDSQMARYNFSGDSGTIFQKGYLQGIQINVTTSDSGELLGGCFLKNEATISTSNSSWAIESNLSSTNHPVSNLTDLLPILSLTANLTDCGISPLLNITLLNLTAQENFTPYQNLSYSTIWSWAPGEPRNYTNITDSTSSSLFRCATTGLTGRWTVTDCSQKFYAGCRALGQPYNWTITRYSTSYASASTACPVPYLFSAPRTSLENRYLTQAILSSPSHLSSQRIWVDFNSLDVEGCWTMGGINASCPYAEAVAESDELRKRVILVPTIAAVIVLFITALTVFGKVAGNKQTSRRARRRNTRFVYEGVPS